MKGWFSIYREFMESPLWLKEKFTRGQAWIDLIGLANYEDGYVRIRGNKFVVKRGQVGWSIKKLAKRWGWSRGRVNRHIDELEMEHRIEQQKNSISSLITIINYDKFQKTDTKQYNRRTQSDTADGHQTDTKNKNNNNNKYNNARARASFVDTDGKYFMPLTRDEMIAECKDGRPLEEHKTYYREGDEVFYVDSEKEKSYIFKHTK